MSDFARSAHSAARRGAAFRAVCRRTGPRHLGTQAFRACGASLGGRDWDTVELSDSELWNVHFPPFKAAIKEGAGAIMAAYRGSSQAELHGSFEITAAAK